MTVAEAGTSRNRASEISTRALGLLGHIRASMLTARERDDLWAIATGNEPVTAVSITTVERISAKLEGRRRVTA